MFKEKVLEMIKPETEFVILYMGSVHNTDSTTLEILINMKFQGTS